MKLLPDDPKPLTREKLLADIAPENLQVMAAVVPSSASPRAHQVLVVGLYLKGYPPVHNHLFSLN